MNTTSNGYTRTAIALHWVIALLIFAAFPLGMYMSDLPLSPNKLRLYSFHKWIGVTIMMFVVLRVLWRIGHRPPPLPDTVGKLEKIAAHGMHFLLYLLILAIPISGWLMSSAKGFQTVWFGVLPLPDLIGKDKELGKLLEFVHVTLNYLLLAAVIGHSVAALKHHFITRDTTLARMLPFLRK